MTTIDIVGGGVAGLALAAGLDPARFRVRLHERAPERRELGTVFGLWPHALRSLRALGLDDRVRELSRPAGGATLFTASGRRLTTNPGPADARLIPRPDLLAVLGAAVPPAVERITGEVVDAAALGGDLVVAADGAYSVVRDRVWGRAARRTGVMAFRGVIDGDVAELNPGQVGLHEFWGGRSLFGVTPNTRGTTNWYASMAEFAATPAEAIAWARDHYAGWPPVVGEVLRRADPERTLVNRIVEAPTLRSLVRGRHVLVGDAAHAMSPNLGRGACEALVDAVALAEYLSTRPVPAALAAYERRRLVPGQAVRVASAAVRRLALNPRLPSVGD